jgi:hypothetical protein
MARPSGDAGEWPETVEWCRRELGSPRQGVKDRSGLRSTVLTSQLPIAMWHDAIGEPTLADVLLYS